MLLIVIAKSNLMEIRLDYAFANKDFMMIIKMLFANNAHLIGNLNILNLFFEKLKILLFFNLLLFKCLNSSYNSNYD